MEWGPKGVTTGATNLDNGKENTATLLARTDGPYLAAEYCQTLNNQEHEGHTDWYLPAINQLEAGMNKFAVEGASNWIGFEDYIDYWSSTEFSDLAAGDVYYYNGVGTSSSHKDTDHYNVRCFR